MSIMDPEEKKTTEEIFLDSIGGENLDGSGFEEEEPDPEFTESEATEQPE